MISKVSSDGSVLNRVLAVLMNKPVRMSVEFDYFKWYRSFSDGVDFLRTTFEYNNKGDHTPQLNLFIGMFNFNIIELGVYNTYHEVDEDDDEFEANLDVPYKLEPKPTPVAEQYIGKRVCGNCKHYGHNAPEHGLTSQCVLNGSGVMPEGFSCGGDNLFVPLTPIHYIEDI